MPSGNSVDSSFKIFFDVVPPNEETLLSFLIRGLTAAERTELATFLDQVLAEPDASVRLARLWKKSQADFFISPESRIADFFQKIRQRL